MKSNLILSARILSAMGLGLAMASGPVTAAAPAKGKILIVVSSENRLPLKNGNTYATGYYLNELTVPARHLMEAGYELVFADPKGNEPSMDRRSDDVKYFGGSEAKRQAIRSFHDSLTGLKHPLRLVDVIAGGLGAYDGIFIPGGHAPMTDLAVSPELGTILRAFHAQGKATGLICHGPVALASAVQGADWIYRDYRMTVFSDAEEAIAQTHMGGEVTYSVEAKLRALGGQMHEAAPWQAQAVSDRELVTGQNPFSDEKFTELYLQALTKR